MHTWIATLCQIIGLGLVLWNINANFAELENTSLWRAIKNQIAAYWKSRPCKERSVGVSGELHAITLSPVTGTITGKMQAVTDHDRIVVLENQVEELDKRVNLNKQYFEEKILALTASFEQKIDEAHTATKRVDSTVKGLFLGNLKIQLFGFVLILWGAIAAVLPTSQCL